MNNPRKTKIIVEKVYTPRPTARPKKFPSQPVNYLELFENKSRVKPDLVNKEYTPPKEIEKMPEHEIEEYKEPLSEPTSPRSDYGDSEPDSPKSSHSNYEELKFRSPSTSTPSKSKSSGSSSDDQTDDEVLNSRLKDILSDEKRDERREERTQRQRTPDYKEQQKDNDAPRLSEIEGGSYIPKRVIEELDFNKLDVDEEDTKRELLFKFSLLQKSYPNTDIPEFTVHSDYKHMQRTYENTLKQINIDNNVESYKNYLIMAFYVIEYALGYYAGFDMNGFTKNQIVSMNKYSALLIELGEKNYEPGGSKWSVEMRLLFMVIIQTAIFCVTKFMMNKFMGGNNPNAFAEVLNPSHNQPTQQPAKKSSMKGPPAEYVQ